MRRCEEQKRVFYVYIERGMNVVMEKTFSSAHEDNNQRYSGFTIEREKEDHEGKKRQSCNGV